MEKLRISAVVLCKNEGTILDRCLKSLSFCDEIIVIDDFSEDSSAQIAKKYNARVFQKNLEEHFADQRNFGLEKTNHEWVIFVDADEEITPELAEEITSLLSTDISFSAFYIKRRDYFWNTEVKYGEVAQARRVGFIRLVKKGKGHWQGKVHEVFITKGTIGQLNHFINHFPHPTITDFLKDINIYSSLRAQELRTQRKKTNIFEIITYPVGKFIWTYFLNRGFADGAAGFAYSFFMSFHSFLVRAKLYQYTEVDKKP